MAVGVAIIGGAIIGAVGAGIASSRQSSAIENAASTSAEATQRANEMQLAFLQEQDANMARAVSSGLVDLDTGFNMAIKALGPQYDAIGQYINLLKNPNQVMNNPGVKFQYNQGIKALQTGFSRTSGGGLSGNVVAAAERYGQNFASTALDSALARLDPLIANQIRFALLYKQEGIAKANLKIGKANASANLGAPIMSSIASNTISGGNTAAQAMIAQGNVAANNILNITGGITDLASLYVAQPQLFSNWGSGSSGSGSSGGEFSGLPNNSGYYA